MGHRGSTTAEEDRFLGTIGRTHHESQPHWPEPVSAPEGAPNVITVVLDDVGFADFGCFGSEIETPTIDALASGGLRYTNFHTTPLCSPTRASLLTGRNHHSVGMRLLSNLDTGFPSGRGFVSPRAATVAEILRDEGFNTMCVGKWHLAPTEQTTAAGPYDQWPLGRGFERYYGFLEAETDCFYPELTYDNHAIDPPGKPEDGYHLTTDLVDKAIEFIRDQSSVAPERPFFMHLAFAAAHAPHQAPESYLEQFRGRYDRGWDEIRRERHARQLELGILPAGTELSPRNPSVEPWDELSADQQRLFARMQEAYAAMVAHTDAELGRLVTFLRRMGRLDNTLILVMSDNGASQEGCQNGSLNPVAYQNQVEQDFEKMLAEIDLIGGPKSHSNYPWGWAQASNTPFRRYKQNTHEGGVHAPLVVHWPVGVKERGGIRRQFHHVIDITPTVLSLTGVEPPTVYRGVSQLPVHGVDLSYTFEGEGEPTRHETQYFEMFGHRAIWHKGWKAVAYHERGTSYDDDQWELFRVDEDWAECRDLSQDRPDVLREMTERFWAEAGKYDVLPLDDRGFADRARIPRPGSPRLRRTFTYYPGMAHLPAAAAPPTMNRSHKITAFVDRRDPTEEGVLVALGGHTSGYVMYIKGNRLCFEYNYLGRHYRIESTEDVPTGAAKLEFQFEKTGDQEGVGSLFINAASVGKCDFPRVVSYFHGFEGLDIGRDGLAPVTDSYEGEFPYSGALDKVVIEVAPSEDEGWFEVVD
jgi:arylsulfatase A-like enzyme